MTEKSRRNIMHIKFGPEGVKVEFVDPPEGETEAEADVREATYQVHRQNTRRETDPTGSRALLRKSLARSSMDTRFWGD